MGKHYVVQEQVVPISIALFPFWCCDYCCYCSHGNTTDHSLIHCHKQL